MDLVFALGFVVLGWFVWVWFRPKERLAGQHRVRRQAQPGLCGAHVGGCKSRKKAAWVIKEVIRLKALMFGEGCRTVASAFNARFEWRGESVGKTFVAETLKRHREEVLLCRKKLNRRKRKKGPRNRGWCMDLTFASNGPNPTPVLGVIDHGSRRLLCLQTIRDRTSFGILRVLLGIINRYGRPKFLRTDNEAIFNSKLMLSALWLLGIRKQTTDPLPSIAPARPSATEGFCPWQNGCIERLFRTLKERLYPYWEKVGIPENIQVDLNTFKHWPVLHSLGDGGYNYARAHQSLSGVTPVMAWFDKTHQKPPRFFRAWKGILTGWVPS